MNNIYINKNSLREIKNRVVKYLSIVSATLLLTLASCKHQEQKDISIPQQVHFPTELVGEKF
jgi:hypothetical protein